MFCGLISDLDVHSGAGDHLRGREIDQGLPIEHQAGQDPQGRPVPGQCAGTACVQASRVQVQERAVHIRQLRCSLSFPMVINFTSS